MRMLAGIFATLFSGQSSALRLSSEAGPIPDHSVDIFVINMDKRNDRCKCMQSQLSGHRNVSRQPAVNADDPRCQFPRKADIYRSGRQNVPREKSLFCNNYLIWRDAALSSADYVIILEDDVYLKPGWWTKVNTYLNSCGDFDYLLVDPMRTFGGHWRGDFWHNDGDLVASCSMGGTYQHHNFSDTHGKAWLTTSMQIIRREFLPALIKLTHENGWAAIDHWWQHFIPKHRAFGWSAGILTQMSVGNRALIKEALAKSGCGESVMQSDIGVGRITTQKQRTASRQPLLCAP